MEHSCSKLKAAFLEPTKTVESSEKNIPTPTKDYKIKSTQTAQTTAKAAIVPQNSYRAADRLVDGRDGSGSSDLQRVAE